MSPPGTSGIGFGGAGAGFGLAGAFGLLCAPAFFETQKAPAGGTTAVARRRVRRQARSGGGGGGMARMARSGDRG